MSLQYGQARKSVDITPNLPQTEQKKGLSAAVISKCTRALDGASLRGTRHAFCAVYCGPWPAQWRERMRKTS